MYICHPKHSTFCYMKLSVLFALWKSTGVVMHCFEIQNPFRQITMPRVLQFTFGDHPQLVLSCGSKFPDKLKVRKRLRIWPLTFKLRADFVTETKELHLGCSCRVRFLPICNSQISVIFSAVKLEVFASMRGPQGVFPITTLKSYFSPLLTGMRQCHQLERQNCAMSFATYLMVHLPVFHIAQISALHSSQIAKSSKQNTDVF
jgi:hypothetical protein